MPHPIRMETNDQQTAKGKAILILVPWRNVHTAPAAGSLDWLSDLDIDASKVWLTVFEG